MGIFIFYHSTKTYFPQVPPLGGVHKVLLCCFRQTRAGWQSDSMPCVQRFHSEEILSEGAEILSEGAEILSGIAKVSTAARFRLVTSSVPPGSEVPLLCVGLVSPNTEIFETTNSFR